MNAIYAVAFLCLKKKVTAIPASTITLPTISFNCSVSCSKNVAQKQAITVWLNKAMDTFVDSKKRNE